MPTAISLGTCFLLALGLIEMHINSSGFESADRAMPHLYLSIYLQVYVSVQGNPSGDRRHNRISICIRSHCKSAGAAASRWGDGVRFIPLAIVISTYLLGQWTTTTRWPAGYLLLATCGNNSLDKLPDFDWIDLQQWQLQMAKEEEKVSTLAVRFVSQKSQKTGPDCPAASAAFPGNIK